MVGRGGVGCGAHAGVHGGRWGGVLLRCLCAWFLGLIVSASVVLQLQRVLVLPGVSGL